MTPVTTPGRHATPLGADLPARGGRGVLRDSPAMRAGLLADDVIVTVDGEPVDGLTIDEVVAGCAGRAAPTVTLSIVRGRRSRSS